ncbi:MAG: chloramphenicol phosphotransferase CPT family protein [Longimicrobiaceae bacterium]
MIILLNGTSCSGKTTLARAVQALMPEPYLHIGLDYFEAMQPVRDGRRINVIYGQRTFSDVYEERGPDFLPVLHRTVRAFSDEGAHAVVEHMFLKRRWLKDAVETLADAPVMFVEVHCPLPTLEERERSRPNAYIGQAEEHHRKLARLREAGIHDLTVDTAAMDPAACARAIQERMHDGAPIDALRRLRGSPLLDEPDVE